MGGLTGLRTVGSLLKLPETIQVAHRVNQCIRIRVAPSPRIRMETHRPRTTGLPLRDHPARRLDITSLAGNGQAEAAAKDCEAATVGWICPAGNRQHGWVCQRQPGAGLPETKGRRLLLDRRPMGIGCRKCRQKHFGRGMTTWRSLQIFTNVG